MLFRIIAVYLSLTNAQALTTAPTANTVVNFAPSSVEFHHVSKQYPITWQRRLLSSVPIREYALQDITLSLESHQIVLLRGASSSGKSTLLQAILQHDDDDNDMTHPWGGTTNITSGAKPVYLEQQPTSSLGSSISIRELLDGFWTRHTNKSLLLSYKQNQDAVVDCLARHVGFHDNNENWDTTRVLDLSPSETYRLALLLACLESSCCCSSSPTDEATTIYCTEQETLGKCSSASRTIHLPAPVLLLDEWMDKETSVVIQTVQKAMWDLTTQTGALVLTVTHKQERWRDDLLHLKITLSGGKVLQRLAIDA